MTTKLDPNLIVASGTPSNSTYLRGDGSWSALVLPPIWVTQAGSIAVSNEQVAFSTNLVAADPAGLTLTYSVVSGALPSGLTLSSSGVISGTVTRVFTNTVSNFTVSVTNGTQAKQRAFSITVNNNINEAPNWSTAAGSIGAVNMGSVFNYNLSATDPNNDAVTYSIFSGSLPSGLSMNSSGVITGTASTVGVTTTSNFTVRATDSNLAYTDRDFSITVNSTMYYITNSLRFDGLTKYLSKTYTTTTTFTFSFWVKKCKIGGTTPILSNGNLSQSMMFESSARSDAFTYQNNVSPQAYRDPSAWYHIVISSSSCWINNQGVGGYGSTVIPFSNLNFGFDGSNYFNGYLADFYYVDGAALTPTSFGKFDSNGNWVPTAYTGSGVNIPVYSQYTPTGSVFGDMNDYGFASNAFNGNTNQNGASVTTAYGSGTIKYIGKVFSSAQPISRVDVYGTNDYGYDGSGSTSITISVYGKSSTPTNSTDGTLLGSTTFTDDNTVNYRTVTFSPASYQYVWVRLSTGNNCFIGQVQYFTTSTNIYGANGFHLEFKNSSNLGLDTSGNGNHWTANGTTSADQMIDSPTNNYATMNPLIISKEVSTYSSMLTYQNGNLKVSRGATWGNGFGSMPMIESGSYFELSSFDNGGGYGTYGITSIDNISSVNNNDSDYYYNPYTGTVNYQSGPSNITPPTVLLTSAAYGTTPVHVGIAYKNGKLYFRVNGDWLNNADPAAETGYVVSGLSGKTWLPTVSLHTAGATMNFGATPFTYTPPTGFVALCTNNLPSAPITSPSNYFNPVIWTGTGASKAVTGVGFQPDLVWVKNRTSAQNHRLCNSVTGNALSMSSNTTSAEVVGGGYFTSIDPTGFTTGNAPDVNNNGDNYIAWLWKKGVTPGFDIVTYNGNGGAYNQKNHSLGVVPAFAIIKDRTSAYDWIVWHTSLGGSDQFLKLNTTDQKTNSNSPLWSSSSGGWSPTQFPVNYNGVNQGTNKNTNNYVAYLWAEIPGFSKFGSYTGNGNIDGTFVYCGFKPRYIMVKDVSIGDAGSSWCIWDTIRWTYNQTDGLLFPNSSGVEQIGQTNVIDVLSNGFKLRSTSTSINGNRTYIFAAFAELPFGGNNISPAPAR
jgi:hypothetical protein